MLKNFFKSLNDETTTSRRNFLKGAATIGIGAAVSTLPFMAEMPNVPEVMIADIEKIAPQFVFRGAYLQVGNVVHFLGGVQHFTVEQEHDEWSIPTFGGFGGIREPVQFTRMVTTKFHLDLLTDDTGAGVLNNEMHRMMDFRHGRNEPSKLIVQHEFSKFKNGPTQGFTMEAEGFFSDIDMTIEPQPAYEGLEASMTFIPNSGFTYEVEETNG